MTFLVIFQDSFMISYLFENLITHSLEYPKPKKVCLLDSEGYFKITSNSMNNPPKLIDD